MGQTVSKTDENGEETAEHLNFANESQLKIIQEFHHNTAKNEHQKGTKTSKIKIQDSDSSVLPMDDEDVNYDPIGSHLIELRKYYHDLNQKLIDQTKQRTSGKSVKKQIEDEFPAPPEFPENYPFSDVFEDIPVSAEKLMVNCSSYTLPTYLLEIKRKDFIKRVIEQVGFFDIENENLVLEHLSAILDDYLEKFITLFSHETKSEYYSEDEDLLNALETTLRKFEIDGIFGLHTFYYENIVKKHDVLERKCSDMYDELQELYVTIGKNGAQLKVK